MKTCRECGVLKKDEEFPIKKGETRDTLCKECKRAHSRKWYSKNRERHKASVRDNNRRYRRERRWQKKLDDLKRRPCADCGKTYPPCAMDFDHVRGEKVANVSRLIADGYVTKALEEAKKCDVVCAVCHRLRHCPCGETGETHPA